MGLVCVNKTHTVDRMGKHGRNGDNITYTHTHTHTHTGNLLVSR